MITTGYYEFCSEVARLAGPFLATRDVYLDNDDDSALFRAFLDGETAEAGLEILATERGEVQRG